MKSILFMFFVMISVVMSPVWPSLARAENGGAVTYFANLPDIPIMPNMVEIEEEGFSFDTPQGRVVQAYSFIPGMGIDQVMVYYRRALPGLGWRFNGKDGFVRGGEALTIQPAASIFHSAGEQNSDGNYIIFALKAAP